MPDIVARLRGWKNRRSETGQDVGMPWSGSILCVGNQRRPAPAGQNLETSLARHLVQMPAR